ncbi:MAG: Sir2 family NAD-dependent protein deacetylase [Myxococcota bacterium]
MTLPGELRRLLDLGLGGSGPIVFLTGAGISAESGIPTFRGEEGYWTVGSRHYRPEELATSSAFRAMPEEVWSWYLYRRGVCRRADPNPAHRALVDLEHGFHERLVVITQNVDGLHLRAGSTPQLTYQIHGNLDFMRFDDSGDRTPTEIPPEIDQDWERGRRVRASERELLSREGTLGRPHVLWFDEHYDEHLFRFESSLSTAAEASLLVVVGTSGVTNLPLQVAGQALRRNVPFVVLNRDEDTSFAELAHRAPRGHFERGPAGELVPAVTEYMMTHGLDRLA